MRPRPTTVRLAGWGLRPDGATVTWTISTGRRGRRWREVVAEGDAVRHSLLLETDPAGAFSHLELGSAAGLWTLHPEGDGTLHGNHVRADGAVVEHVTGWPFGAGNVVDVAGSPIAAAALVWGVAARVREGDAIEVAGVRLDPVSGLARVPAILVARLGPTRWQLGDDQAVEVDADGVPGLAGGRTVPLELG